MVTTFRRVRSFVLLGFREGEEFGALSLLVEAEEGFVMSVPI
jgi:hypothetical protein